MIQCYENIIGLAPVNTTCVPEMPPQYEGSKSGLYVSDLGVLDILGDEYKTSMLWDNLSEDRERATLAFIAETNTLLQRKVRHRMNPYTGKIGEPSGQGYTAYQNLAWRGIRIYCKNIPSAYIYLKSVYLSFNNSTDKILKIKDKYNNLLYENTAVHFSGGKATVGVNLKLPTADHFGSMEYFIYFDSVSGSGSLNNKIVCQDCTGFTAPFDKTNLPFYKQYKAGIGWANWMMIQGVDFNNDLNFDTFDSTVTVVKRDNSMSGIMLDMSVGCGIDEILCDQVKNFSVNAFSMSIAKAIQLKTAELFLTSILSSQKISRTTMINHEQVAAMRQEWRQECNEIINYVTSNIEVSENQCFDCRGLLDIGLGKIIS